MLPKSYQISNHLSLRPYQSKDETRFVEMGIDEEVIKFMDGASGEEQAERALFQKILKLYTSKSSARIFNVWGIYSENRLCGHLELKETENTAKDELEIVYMIHPKERGKGIMSMMLNYIKENQAIWRRKIIATIHPKNTPSFRLLEKWGIKRYIDYPEKGFIKVELLEI